MRVPLEMFPEELQRIWRVPPKYQRVSKNTPAWTSIHILQTNSDFMYMTDSHWKA